MKVRHLKSMSLGSLSIIWVVSIIWLIGATPLVCTTPSEIVHDQSSIPSGIPDFHEPRMSMGLLSGSESLMRGINMAWYTNTQTAQFTLGDDTVVEEDITPYWFSIGFDRDILRADLDALQTMGVRHLRISALIFQFVVWDDEFGSLGLNGSIMNKFDLFLAEVQSRGMVLTISLLGPFWSNTEHPSLMKYFRIFDETSGMDQWALHNLGLSMVEFAQYYRLYPEIHTWELVSSFSKFTDYLSNSQTGFGLTINATALFDFIEYVAEGIRSVDDLHLVTVSDGWPPDFAEDWWTTGLVPFEYEGRLKNLTDYIALCYHSDDTIPNPQGEIIKYGAIVEIASTQPYNHSRELNSEVLLNAYTEAINKSYSAFCPWEFSQNMVVHEEDGSISNHNRHDWTWDALLLFSLYRNDSVKFIDTTNWYVLSSEPQIDLLGKVSFTLFHRPEGAYPAPFGFEDGHIYDPAEGGTEVTVLSRYLLMGDTLVINRNANYGEPLYNHEELGIFEYGSTLATIYDVGYVEEIGIRVASNSTWDSIVDKYEDSQIVLEMNSTGLADIEIENGKFILIQGNNYAVSYTDKISGATWQEVVKANENQTILVHVNASSVTIRITLNPEVLGLISVGMSISVIMVSIVLFYYADRKTAKE
ncbi:hypothetical protein EU528_04740 [Candidatus Thorarchaeota archaeon]|nr:MAG: hypothetical protein EU528_04740 [Candidatus Thorarchaeota archaeon]